MDFCGDSAFAMLLSRCLAGPEIVRPWLANIGEDPGTILDAYQMDKGEMTDKGSINQRVVLKHRSALVEELYATPLSPRIVAIEESKR
jgi:hypothetical protein